MIEAGAPDVFTEPSPPEDVELNVQLEGAKSPENWAVPFKTITRANSNASNLIFIIFHFKRLNNKCDANAEANEY